MMEGEKNKREGHKTHGPTIMEELESLEETLNDSIRESLGARSGKSSRGRQKGAAEDEDEFLSDDDEFYDRTKTVRKPVDTQSIETADSLLDKKEALVNEMEEKLRLILEEKNKAPEPDKQDAGDALDAFMSGLSSQLVHDKTLQLERDLSSLQAELDRIVYLLKFADPTGDAAKKRETTSQKPKSNESASSSVPVKRPEKSQIELKKVIQDKKPVSTSKKVNHDGKPISRSITKETEPNVTEEAIEKPKPDVDVADPTGRKPAVYQVAKPQWLGAVADKEREETQQEKHADTHDDEDGFIDYQHRNKILSSNNSQPELLESDLENAAPGLILRKKKQVKGTETREEEPSNPSTQGPAGADMMAENAIALLLKHKRGLHASDEEVTLESHDRRGQKSSGQDNKRPRRVLGPEKPAFLQTNSDYETWVPPEGQSGDGRTSLNDRLGY